MSEESSGKSIMRGQSNMVSGGDETQRLMRKGKPIRMRARSIQRKRIRRGSGGRKTHSLIRRSSSSSKNGPGRQQKQEQN